MMRLSRRGFLSAGVSTAATLMISKHAFAMPTESERSLGIHNLHTGESFNGAYWVKGDYLPDALSEVRRVMRDFRTGDEHEMAPTLLDLLVGLRARVESKEPFQIISGYRSPKTNAMLHENSGGVAVHSYHMQGKATDIRLPGCALSNLHEAALSMRLGGVGYYPSSDFVHVDVGPVRRWE